MIFSHLRKSRFARALEQYGLSRCSVSRSTIWVGLGPDPEYGREPLAAVPRAPRSLCFVEAPLQAALVAALAGSPEARTLEHLMIGTSHAFAENGPANYDMTGAVASLRHAHFPVLRRLSLGDMELLFNGHRLFGTLGDITHILAAAPQLQSLELHGHFTLREPVHHATLRTLSVWVAETAVSGGLLSQVTVSRLLSSRLPHLETLDLDLDEGDPETTYAIPEAFFTGTGFPVLAAFEMNSLAPETQARLDAWTLKRRAL